MQVRWFSGSIGSSFPGDGAKNCVVSAELLPFKPLVVAKSHATLVTITQAKTLTHTLKPPQLTHNRHHSYSQISIHTLKHPQDQSSSTHTSMISAPNEIALTQMQQRNYYRAQLIAQISKEEYKEIEQLLREAMYHHPCDVRESKLPWKLKVA